MMRMEDSSRSGVAALVLALAGAVLPACVGHCGDLTVDDLTVYGKHCITQEVETGEVPTDGLVLYYTFNTDESGIVTDQSSNSNTGTVNGATWSSSGKISGAYDFDGSDDRISAPDDDSLYCTNFTVAAWINWGGGGSQYNAIVAKRTVTNSTHYYNFIVTLNNDVDKVDFFSSGLSETWLRSTSAIDEGQWTHVAGSYDGTYLRLYLNGALDNSTPSTGSPDDDAGPLSVGADYPGAWGDYFDGMIDHVAIYNRALSSNEVYSLYLHNDDLATPSMEVHAEAEFTSGIKYVEPLGDVSMGTFTNKP